LKRTRPNKEKKHRMFHPPRLKILPLSFLETTVLFVGESEEVGKTGKGGKDWRLELNSQQKRPARVDVGKGPAAMPTLGNCGVNQKTRSVITFSKWRKIPCPLGRKERGGGVMQCKHKPERVSFNPGDPLGSVKKGGNLKVEGFSGWGETVGKKWYGYLRKHRRTLKETLRLNGVNRREGGCSAFWLCGRGPLGWKRCSVEVEAGRK